MKAKEAFKNSLFRSYGRGGGQKVPIITLINKITGDLVSATYFLSK